MLGIFCTLEKNILRIHTHSNDQQKMNYLMLIIGGTLLFNRMKLRITLNSPLSY